MDGDDITGIADEEEVEEQFKMLEEIANKNKNSQVPSYFFTPGTFWPYGSLILN